MTRGISAIVKKLVIQRMIEENLDVLVFHGFTFSTENVPGAIPTGEKTKTGKEIYIHP